MSDTEVLDNVRESIATWEELQRRDIRNLKLARRIRDLRHQEAWLENRIAMEGRSVRRAA